MRKLMIFFMILALVLMGAGVVNASTSAQKQTAIDNGLAYLAATQNADGSWTDVNSSSYDVADTGAALLAFTEQYYKPLGWDGKNYSTVVTKATNYLMSQASVLTFSAPNWWGYNGTGNSGQGLQWTNGGEETYGSGIAISGLCGLVSNPSGGTPLVNPSTVISSSNAAVNGLTYAQVIQKSLDSWTWGQSPPSTGNRYGGWRYFTAQNDSDMSTTQWPIADYLFAKPIPGVTIPGTAASGDKTSIGVNAFVTACQYPNAAYPSGYPAGSVDYQPGANLLSLTHIGGLLLANALTGGGAGNVTTALAYLNAHWTDTPNNTWYGNEGNAYAMFAIYKGLESQYGTTGAGPITNLNPQTTAIDPGATWNWWEDYCQSLCTTQNADGSWPGYGYWYGPLEAAWYVNILNATAIAPPAVPLPSSVLLLGSGLLGLAGWRRFKKS